MKNQKNKIAGLILSLFAMLAFTNTKAQCVDQIHNTLNCSINVTIRVYNSCPGAPCNAYVTNIAAGAIVPVNCGPCTGPICNVEVRINSVGGSTTGMPITIDYSTTPSASFSIPTSCGSGTRIFEYYPGPNYTFKIHP